MSDLTLIVIILVVLLLLGGGGYWYRGRGPYSKYHDRMKRNRLNRGGFSRW
ncbi:MAG: hypothetical protein ACR2JW_00020 [Thermomicrobiales bacterium]